MHQGACWDLFKDELKEFVGDEDFRPINVCEMFHSICRLVCRIEYNIEKTKDQGIRDDFSDTASW
nr:hypothetical protein [Eubacterium sp.]